MKVYKDIYRLITSPENLFTAWDIFKRDKQKKKDVLKFGMDIEKNIFQLHHDLTGKTYRHGPYSGFWICDPKRRRIHKALVRDRVVHHALFRVINNIFEPMFIPTSFSCRIGKGTHKGVRWLAKTAKKVSQNYTKPCYALKCDIRHFFDNVDHEILLEILGSKIKDPECTWLLREVIHSFGVTTERERERERETKCGLPIGNLTSQIFANVYMNEFDQFVKHVLKVKYYARYTDDFVILSSDEEELRALPSHLRAFLGSKLKLELHPQKISVRPLRQGVDFLGYVVLPYRIVLRTRTKRRIFRKLKQRVLEFKKRQISRETLDGAVRSYSGVLSQANARKLEDRLKNNFWFWLSE